MLLCARKQFNKITRHCSGEYLYPLHDTSLHIGSIVQPDLVGNPACTESSTFDPLFLSKIIERGERMLIGGKITKQS
jgi:hypothetical protein